MTTPEPLPTEPLLTKARLAVWAQENPLLDEALADVIIDGVTTLLRQYGSATWTTANIPPRARDIGYIVAKDYYLNPRLLRQETTGPLQESIDNKALRGLDLDEVQKAELAALANDTPNDVDGLWLMPIGRGDDLIHRRRRPTNVVIFDTRAGWPVEYLDESEAVVFFPEEPAP